MYHSSHERFYPCICHNTIAAPSRTSGCTPKRDITGRSRLSISSIKLGVGDDWEGGELECSREKGQKKRDMEQPETDQFADFLMSNFASVSQADVSGKNGAIKK